MHQVVVGSLECFISNLTNFRSYFHFWIRTLKLEYFLQTAYCAHLSPASHIASRQVFFFFYFRVNGNSVCERESLFRNVTIPAEGVSAFQCMIHGFHQLIKRKIVHTVVFPVIGNFNLHFTIVWLMGKAGQLNIVVCIDAQ